MIHCFLYPGYALRRFRAPLLYRHQSSALILRSDPLHSSCLHYSIRCRRRKAQSTHFFTACGRSFQSRFPKMSFRSPGHTTSGQTGPKLSSHSDCFHSPAVQHSTSARTHVSRPLPSWKSEGTKRTVVHVLPLFLWVLLLRIQKARLALTELIPYFAAVSCIPALQS